MRINYPVIIGILLLLIADKAWANWTLPEDAINNNGDFANCTYTAPSGSDPAIVSCNSQFNLNNSNATLLITEPLLLVTDFDLTLPDGIAVNPNRQSFTLQALNNRIINNGDNATINAQLRAQSLIANGGSTVINGDIIVTGSITINSGVSVNGRIRSAGTVMNNGIVSSNIDSDGTVTINSGASAGSVNARGAVSNNGTVISYINAPTIEIENNGTVETTCNENSNFGPCEGSQDPQFSQQYCSDINGLLTYGIVGSSGFTYGNNSKINNYDIDGFGNTPTPTGNVDTVDLVYPPLEPATYPAFSGGTNIPPMPSGSVNPGTFGTIEVNNNLTFTGSPSNPYYIDELIIANGAAVNFGPGDYFIRTITLNTNSIVTTTAGQVTNLYIENAIQGTKGGGGNGNGNGNNKSNANQIEFNSSGQVTSLQVYLYDGATIAVGNGNQGSKETINFNGLIYGPFANNDINFGNNNTIQGSILTAGDLDVGGKTEFIYTEEIQLEIATALGCDPTGGNVIDHIRLLFPDNQVSCLSAPVEVQACANEDCSNAFTDSATVNLQSSASQSHWYIDGNEQSNNAAVSFSGGSTDVALRYVETGNTTLSIADSTPLKCFDSAGVTEYASCDILFKPAGLVFTHPDNFNPIPAGAAGEDFYSRVRAIETDTTTGACQGAISGEQTLYLGVEAINPVSLAGGSYTVNSTPVQLYDLGNRPAFSALTSSVQVTFDSDGRAELQNNYTDVGQLRMAGFVTVSADGADPAFSLSGTSINDYVVKPYELIFTTLNDDNSPATVTTGEEVSGFKAAGESFKGRIRSLNADGNITPNFGNELTPESVVASFAGVVFPTTPHPGSKATKLQGETSFSGGNGEFFSDSLRWLEAGTISIEPQLADGDYLGADDVTLIAGNAGRFYPAKFVIKADSLTDAVSCSLTGASYSYMGQPGITLSYEVKAVNTDGDVTKYYSHSEMGDIDYGATLLAKIRPLTNFDSTFNPLERFSNFPTTTNLWDEGKLIFEDAAISFDRLTNAPYVDGPYNGFHIGLVADTQPDGVDFGNKTRLIDGTLTAPIAGELNLRYGRAVLPQLAGGGFDEIPIEFGIEIYDSALGSFVTHTDDSCYALSQDFVLTDNADNDVTPTGLNDPPAAELVAGELSSGAKLLPRPSGYDVNKNPYRLEYDAEAWLRYEWDGEDNDYDEPPAAKVYFDTYRGDDRIIFWLEQW